MLNGTYIYGYGVWTPFTPSTDQKSESIEMEFERCIYVKPFNSSVDSKSHDELSSQQWNPNRGPYYYIVYTIVYNGR